MKITKEKDAKGDNEETVLKKRICHTKKILKKHDKGNMDESKINAVIENHILKDYVEYKEKYSTLRGSETSLASN